VERVRLLTQEVRCVRQEVFLAQTLWFLWLAFNTREAPGCGGEQSDPSEGGIRVYHWQSDSPLGDPGPGVFRAHGLDAELIFIASSSQGMPALLAGQIPIYSGSLETAAQAAAAGADLVVIASSEPTQYKLIVQPGIKSAADLKGKKVGIDRSVGELLRHAPDAGKTGLNRTMSNTCTWSAVATKESPPFRSGILRRGGFHS